MGHDARIGKQVAATRTARRLTQEQLAELAHISLSTLRKVEQGSRRPTDRTLEALADALGVQPDVLAGKRLHTNSRVHAAIPEIRAAIDAYDLPDDGPVRPVAELREATETAVNQRLASQYARLAESISPLLVELSRMAHGPSPGQRRQAAQFLFGAYRAADAVAYKYGYYDLSARLIELMRWAADWAEDPILVATAAYVRTEVFFASSNLAPGLRVLQAALDAMPSPGATGDSAVMGALHMRAAVLAGRLTEDPAAVREHLAEARQLAEDVPEGVYVGTAFGPASVRIHEVSVAVELGDAARAVEAAADWMPPRSLPAERRSHYYIDLARAHLWLGLRDEAFESLQQARKIAPQHVREHPFVRDALVKLLRLHLAPSHALVSYAEWARAI